METITLTIMILGLIAVFAVDTLQKRRNDLNKGK
jgi:hypothetical protein